MLEISQSSGSTSGNTTDAAEARPLRTFNSLLPAMFLGAGRIRIVARVVGLSTPSVVDGFASCRVTLQPILGGGDFVTQPLGDYDLVQMCYESLACGTHVEIIGSFGLEEGHPRQRRKALTVFHLELLTRGSQPTHRVAPPPEVQARADSLIDELGNKEGDRPGRLQEFLVEMGYKHLSSVTSHRSPRLLQCAKAVLLQALSGGNVGPSVNGRISLLICSRPGTSKKLMANLALLLAPVGQMVQPTMVSVAGLGARVDQKKGGWVASRGALPNCSHGTVVIEDMHRVLPSILNAVQGLLMGVAEDGKVNPTKAASATYQAFTALHISTNLQSVVHARLREPGIKGKLKDLGLPFDLLSRIDMLIEMNLGDSALAQARAMVVQRHPKMTPEREKEHADRELLLKTVVARLLERFEEVSIDGMEGELDRLMLDVGRVIEGFSARMDEDQLQLFDCDGLLKRMANSISKLVAAAARLDGRDHVTQQDIDTAWEMLSFKLEVIRWICDDTAQRVRSIRSRQEVVQRTQEQNDERWGLILEKWAGQRVAVCDMATELEMPTRTVARDLESRGYYPKEGWCEIPTLAEEAERQARVAQGEEVAEPPDDYSEDDHHLEDPNEGLEDEEAEEEEEQEDPGPAIRVEPVGELVPVIKGLQSIEDEMRQNQIIKDTLTLAFDRTLSELRRKGKIDTWKHHVWEGMPKSKQNWELKEQVAAQLGGGDEAVAWRMALRLVVHSGLMLTEWEFEELLEARPDLGPAPVDAIKSIIEWHAWDQDRLEKRRLAREAEEAERQEAELWAGGVEVSI